MILKNRFSIVLPAYKSKFFKECITSILNQTYTEFELIIINDCSPEPIEDIVNGFKDQRISYYKNSKNVGAELLVNNWNYGLTKATGNFFLIMGDDDRLDENYLSEFNCLISKYPNMDVYHCRSKIIDELGNVIMLTPSWPELENVYDNIWHRITEKRSQFISDFVYNTNSLKSQGGFFHLPLAWGSDDITAYIASKNKGIAHTNTPVFNYRSNSLSITSSGSDLLKMQANVLYEDWLTNFLKEKPNAPNEIIVYNDLASLFKKYLQKRKIALMTKSMHENLLVKSFLWYRNRKKFQISFIEIGFALLKAVSRKKANEMYKMES
ncbi:family 2 glycosyl transferase [Solitalea longa]|uniref:Family 2 glycosyl transferase n=1 Tax=Solitalea longa TaxID=2079460 RepID=A0A2S4ZX24_9SPHI|nr:glycosyltransferase family 2 protein [Solitalea longa]POY34908.1 family 2 glycosyl transferase [Solitalea longa]